MFPSVEKETEFLTKLGLTISEARVYVTLTQIGTSQIGPISKTTAIQRPNLYPVIRSLEKKCLIEKEIDLPTRYKAVSPREALDMLVKRKRAQICQLKTKAHTIAKNLEIKHAQIKVFRSPQQKAVQFAVIPGKQIMINRLKEEILKAKSSVDVVTSKKRFSSAVLEFAEEYKEALKRGVEIRIATEDHQVSQPVLKILNVLLRNPAFKVRYLAFPPEAIVSIIDKKEALVTMSATADLSGASALWSYSNCFLVVVQNYFDDKWKEAFPKNQEKLCEKPELCPIPV